MLPLRSLSFYTLFARRFVWNFFRLENEHLNNCGQFRVVRDISIHPLYLSRTEEEREGEGEERGEGEEGGERGRNRCIREQRRMSTILMEVGKMDDWQGVGGGEGDGAFPCCTLTGKGKQSPALQVTVLICQTVC